MVTVEEIKKKLSEVIDPELKVSIVDLGLIYDVKLKKKNQVYILMTLTTMGCPLISFIQEDIKRKIAQLGINKRDIKIELTFDPPWSVKKMSKKAQLMLGI